MNMTWEEIVQAVHSGVPSAKEKATLAAIDNLRNYIYSLIKAFSFGNTEMEDMFSIAQLVIIENIDSYDINKGKPTTFFTPALKRAFLNASQGGKQSMYYTFANKKIRDAVKMLADLGVTDPTVEQLADVTELSEVTIEATLDYNKKCVSIDTSEAANMQSGFGNPENEVLQKEKTEKIHKAISKLNVPGQQLVYCIFRYEEEYNKVPSIGHLCKMMNEIFGKSYSSEGLSKLRRDVEEMLSCSIELRSYKREQHLNKIKCSFPELSVIKQEENSLLDNNNLFDLFSEEDDN